MTYYEYYKEKLKKARHELNLQSFIEEEFGVTIKHIYDMFDFLTVDMQEEMPEFLNCRFKIVSIRTPEGRTGEKEVLHFGQTYEVIDGKFTVDRDTNTKFPLSYTLKNKRDLVEYLDCEKDSGCFQNLVYEIEFL